MKLKSKSLMIMSLAFLVASCSSSGYSTYTIESTPELEAYGLAGRTARNQYRGLLGTSIGSLNYMDKAQGSDAQHIANFVDGLLTHNQYGALVKNLATKVTHNADYTQFVFTVKENVPWQRYDGSQYVAKVNGKDVPQFIQPSDWVTTAKNVLTAKNQSELGYLIHTFLKGGAEYYVATEIAYEVDIGQSQIDLANTAKVAQEINKRLVKEFPAIIELEYGGNESPITASMVDKIFSGERLGVTADNANHTVTYKLNQKASFFPTLFTYSCYLPTNEYFLKEVKYSGFGTTNDKMLYCGPYLLKEMGTKKVVYTANKSSLNKSKIGYWNEANTILVDKIDYTVITGSPKPDYTRKEFEANRIDGFGLSYKDAKGWEKYITGKNDEGTYEEPVSPLVNSRLLDTIGYIYGANINVDREHCGNLESYYSQGNATSVTNTSRALSIKEVRKLIMKGYDMAEYFQTYEISKTEELRQEEKVYTYVPKGFCVDSEGNDYATTYYYKEYADRKGINVGDPENPAEGTAAYLLKNGQAVTATLSQDQVDELALDAAKAIKLYNETNPSKAITLPINIEVWAEWYSDDVKEIYTELLQSFNTRLNHSQEAKTYLGVSTIFNAVPTDKVDEDNAEEVSGKNGGIPHFDFGYTLWGWGPDYGDPLTYMNTFVKGGDWQSVFPFVGKKGEETVDNYYLNSTKKELIKTDLLAYYSTLVADAALETENLTARYQKFAKAEYELLEELYFYDPMKNDGQGWSLSVSRSAGYFTPSGNYGIANNRFTGVFVLDEVMTREDRKAARAQQDADKAAFFEHYDAVNGIYDD